MAAMLVAASALQGICVRAEEQLLPEYTEVLESVYDWNFDTDGITAVQDGVTVRFMRDGKFISSGGKSVTGNTGSAANTVDTALTELEGGKNGKSLRLVTNDASAQNQCNAMWSAISYDAAAGNYAVFELDYATADFNARKNAMSVRHNLGWGPGFDVMPDGTLSFNGTAMPIELDKWYRLSIVYDFANKRVIGSVDGELLATFTLSDGVTATERFTIDNRTGGETVSYVDNIKVYSMKEHIREKTFNVTKKSDVAVPSGRNISFACEQKFYDDAHKISVEISSDGVNYTGLLSLAPDTAGFDVPAEYELTYIRVRLFDAEENVLAERNFTAEAIAYDDYKIIRSIDFENAGLNKRSDTRFALEDGGEQISDGGQPWCINTGSSASSVEIAETDDLAGCANKKALKLTTANTTDNVQTNEFYVQRESGWVFIDFDYATNFDGGRQTVLQLNRKDGWQMALTIEGGAFVLDGKRLFAAAADSWYSIGYVVNLDENVGYCYINNSLAGTVRLKDAGALVRYNTSISGAVGSVWIDNIKIASAQPMPQITAASAEGKTVLLTLNRQLDIAAEDITLCSGGNYLTPVSCEYSEGNILKVTTLEQVYTASEISVTVKSGEKTFSGEFAMQPAELDVENVSFSGLNPTARLLNTTGEEKNAVMVMAEKNADGRYTGTKICSATISDSAELSLTADDAAVCEVFFVSDLATCAPIKNKVYRSSGSGSPRTYIKKTAGAAVFTAAFDEKTQSVKIYAENITEPGAPVAVILASGKMSEENPPAAAALYASDSIGGISEQLAVELAPGKYRLYIGTKNPVRYADLIVYQSTSDAFKAALAEINAAKNGAEILAVIGDADKAAALGIDSAAIQYPEKTADYMAALKKSTLDADGLAQLFAYADAAARAAAGVGLDEIMQSSAAAFGTDYAAYAKIAEDVRGEMSKLFAGNVANYGMYTATELELVARLRLCTTAGEVQTLVEQNADGLGISLDSDYAKVAVNSRRTVFADMLAAKSSIFTAGQAAEIFNGSVKKLLQTSSSGTGGGGSSSGGGSTGSSGTVSVGIGSDIVKPTGYSDIAGHFAENAINKLSGAGIISGYADNTFLPDNKISRAEMCRLLTAVSGLTAAGERNFADVGADSWYAPYVNILASNNIVSGDGENFYPDRKITRQDTAVMVAAMLNAKGVLADGEYGFADGDEIGDYAKNSVSSLAAVGLLKGDGVRFYPQNEITRGEAAVLLYGVWVRYYGGQI